MIQNFYHTSYLICFVNQEENKIRKLKKCQCKKINDALKSLSISISFNHLRLEWLLLWDKKVTVSIFSFISTKLRKLRMWKFYCFFKKTVSSMLFWSTNPHLTRSLSPKFRTLADFFNFLNFTLKAWLVHYGAHHYACILQKNATHKTPAKLGIKRASLILVTKRLFNEMYAQKSFHFTIGAWLSTT